MVLSMLAGLRRKDFMAGIIRKPFSRRYERRLLREECCGGKRTQTSVRLMDNIPRAPKMVY